MENFKPGDDVILKDTIDIDTIWRITYMEGNKIYCLSYDEVHGYQSAIFDKSLLEFNIKPVADKPLG